MRGVFLGLALAASLSGVAAAQAVGGSYAVRGTNPDGTAYVGTAQIEGGGGEDCKISWQTGKTTSQGVCLQSGRSFASTYLLQGHLGIVVYEIRPDGSLQGKWYTGGTGPGVGSETLTPQ